MFKAVVLVALLAVAVSDAKPVSSDLQSSQDIGLGYAGIYGNPLGLGYPGVYGNGLGLGLGGVYGANLGLIPGVHGLGRSLGLGLNPYNAGIYAAHQPYSYSNIYRPIHGVNPLSPIGLGYGLGNIGLQNGLIL